MWRTYSLVNNAHDELEVWVELWADLYVVPRGAKITFRYAAEGEIDLLESEIADGRVTLWFNGPDAPEVTIDGAMADPMDQYEWRSRKREQGVS